MTKLQSVIIHDLKETKHFSRKRNISMINNHANRLHFISQPEEVINPSRQQKVLSLVRKLQKIILDDPQNIWYKDTNPVNRIREKGIKLGKIQRAIISAIHEYIKTTDQNPYFFKQKQIAVYIRSNQPGVNRAIKSLQKLGIIWNYGINWNKQTRGILIPVGGVEGWYFKDYKKPMHHRYTILISKLAKLQQKSLTIIYNFIRVNKIVDKDFSSRSSLLLFLKKTANDVCLISRTVRHALLRSYLFMPSEKMLEERRFASIRKSNSKRRSLKIQKSNQNLYNRFVSGRKHIDSEVYYGLHTWRDFNFLNKTKNSKFAKIDNRILEKLNDLCNHGIEPNKILTRKVTSYWYKTIPVQKRDTRPDVDSSIYKKYTVLITWLNWRHNISYEQFVDCIQFMAENGLRINPWKFTKKWYFLTFFADQGNNWLKFLLPGKKEDINHYQYYQKSIYPNALENFKKVFLEICYTHNPDMGEKVMHRFHGVLSGFITNRVNEYKQEQREHYDFPFAQDIGQINLKPSIMRIYIQWLHDHVWGPDGWKDILTLVSDDTWDSFIDWVRKGNLALEINAFIGKAYYDIDEFKDFWHMHFSSESENENF